MPEERPVLAARQGLQVNSSHGSNIGSDHYEQQNTTETLHRPRDPQTRNPEILARALLRARESIQNKENMVPEKSASRRRRRRRVSTSRSPLPADYPRAPLQDITLYMHILQRTRTRARGRMQMHGTTPPRQPMIHVSPSQETHPEESSLQEMDTSITNPTLVLEDPLQETETAITNPTLVLEDPLQETETTMANPILVMEGPLQQSETTIRNPTLVLEDSLQETETTMANPILVLEGPLQQSQTTITNPRQVPEDRPLINCVQLPEQETHGLTTDPRTEEQNYAPERALNHHGNIITDSSLTADVGLGFHHDYHIEDARARNVSMLATEGHDRAFGTVLQSGTWNEQSGRGRGGSHPQPKKKSSLKPLMKMR